MPLSAHEINNLLGKILGCAELGLLKCRETEVQEELNRITELVQAAAQRVRDQSRDLPRAG